MHYRANRQYDPQLDVRDFAELAATIREEPPHGLAWTVVGLRRSGKTWMLKQLFERLPKRHVVSLDLGQAEDRQRFFGEGPSLRRHILLDEPGACLRADPERFVYRLQQLRKSDSPRRVLVALAPMEWEQLAAQLQATGQQSDKDLRFIAPLTDAQAARLASRADWAPAVASKLPANWRQSAFLLELALQVAERYPPLRDDPAQLTESAIRQSADPHLFYWDAVYQTGLNDAQRQAVREAAWHGRFDEGPGRLLVRCGLLAETAGRAVVTDPVVAHQLPPPVRIHHISDVHVGPKSAEAVDVKLKGATGKRLAEGAGAGYVRDTYLDHVRTLAAKGQGPHLLICSGDMVEYGTEEQYAAAQAWFAELAGLINAAHPMLTADAPRVLLVSGNHDVTWSEALGDAGTRQRHTRFHDAFAAYPHPRLDLPPADRGLVEFTYPALGLSILLLGSAEFGGELDDPEDPDQQERIRQLNALRAELAGAIARAGDPATPVDEIQKQIDGLLARLERIDPGLVHKRDLDRVTGHDWSASLVRLAVLHHPLSPVPAGLEIANFSGTLNAAQVKDALLSKRFCLVLHGHVHAGWFGRESWPGRHDDHALHIAAAPSLGSREVQEHHGFNEIALYWEGPGWEVVVTRYIHQGTGWVPEAQMVVRDQSHV